MKLRFSHAIWIVLLLVFTLTLTASVDTASAADTCNAAQFVADVTIPDGTYINAGASFIKTWRIKNVGTCTWTPSYSLVFSSGAQMSGASTVLFPRYVSPNQAVDLTVTLTAPTTAGVYTGYWKLMSASGSVFGIGGAFVNPFWVMIRVQNPLQSIVSYDFVANVCDAQWVYDGGGIACPVNTNKLQLGYVEKLDNPILETGFAAGAPGLLTVPQQKWNGTIRGMFLVDDIFRGDRFQALVGCQYGATNCNVTFALEYSVGGDFFTLYKFRERYDGLVTPIDVDITRLANYRHIVVLSVFAAGEAAPDQPLWIAPRIVRQISAQVPTMTPVPPPSTGPTNTPVGGVTPGCNRAQFISDVTVPDGTTFSPNATFSKVWRLKNVGTCTWTTAYSLAFVSGDRMGGVDTLLPETVVPGQTTDVGVNLTAPNLAGSYRGYWELKDASGNLFGIGTNFDKPFWVAINVVGSSTTTTALDFAGTVCLAQWSNGATVLPCPGTDGDARGFVLPLTNPQLENGAPSSQPGLLTFPQNVDNGFIQGVYPTFTVQSGDRFQGIINCQYGAMDCFVIFRLDAQLPGGVTRNLGTFAEKYDGLYYPLNIDLSSLAGQNVNFVLTVLANGSASGDRAVWVGPRIVRSASIGSSAPSVPSSTWTPVPPTDTPAPVLITDTPTTAPTETSTPVPSDTPMPSATP